jgi:hypothetical protein
MVKTWMICSILYDRFLRCSRTQVEVEVAVSRLPVPSDCSANDYEKGELHVRQE